MKAPRVCILASLILCLCGGSLFAQHKEMKYGKVGKKEFSLYHPTDSTTGAVFLNKEGYTYYRQENDGRIRVESEFKFRLQVLRPEGTRYADVDILYYRSERMGATQEQISAIGASAYNLVDGKVVETPLDRKYIFEEQVTGNYRRYRFSIPDVKPGTIIEYKYRRTSNNPVHLEDWQVQEDIPVCFARYQVDIPEVFQFNITGKGSIPMQRDHKKINSEFIMQAYDGHLSQMQNNRYTFTSTDVPPLKEEPLVWCAENYRGTVSFEIRGLDPRLGISAFQGSSWEGVCTELKDFSGFGNYVNMRNPLRDEQEALALPADMPATEKALRLHRLLHEHIHWDGHYSIATDDSPRKCLDRQQGNNAALNFIYLAMLRDAGIRCTPILVRDKRAGDLTGSEPSLSRLTTFVVGLLDEQGAFYCTDCSLEWPMLNLLPGHLMVNLGICYTPLDGQRLISLADIGTHTTALMFEGSITDGGTLTGKLSTSYTGLETLDALHRRTAEPDSVEHVKKEAERYGLTFHTYKESVTDAYREQMDVSKDLRAGGGIIYLYPFLLDQLPANPFLAEKRTFPVEFPAKFTRRFFGFYRLPEGYEPESLPKPMRMHTHDRMASVSCLLDRRPDGLQVMLELKVNQSIIPARYYGELRELWDVFIESAQTLLTLKRTGGKDGAPVSVSDTAARGDS